VYLDTYGWIMHLQGQDELALFYLKRALNNAKEESQITLYIALFYFDSKERCCI